MKPPCHNRKPYERGYFAPDGYTSDGRRRTVWVENRMSQECQNIIPPFGEAVKAAERGEVWLCDGCWLYDSKAQEEQKEQVVT